jgi:hypothetical protein
VGENNSSSGTISNSYSTGSVSGGSIVGGLVGLNNTGGTVSNSFWDTTTSGQKSSVAGTPLNDTQMMQLASFSSWNATTPNTIASSGGSGVVWRIYEGQTTPLLTSFLTPLTVTANGESKTYNGLTYNGGNGVSYSVSNAVVSGMPVYGGSAQGAVNAGSYTISTSGLYSNQQGYDISYVDGTLTVNKAPLSVAATDISNTYGQTPTLAFASQGLQNHESIGSVTETSSGTSATASVADGPYTIFVSAATGGTFNPGNYSIN